MCLRAEYCTNITYIRGLPIKFFQHNVYMTYSIAFVTLAFVRFSKLIIYMFNYQCHLFPCQHQPHRCVLISKVELTIQHHALVKNVFLNKKASQLWSQINNTSCSSLSNKSSRPVSHSAVYGLGVILIKIGSINSINCYYNSH